MITKLLGNVKLDHPKNEAFGDFAVRGEVDESKINKFVKKIDKVAGFSNLWLKDEVLVGEANKILSDDYKNELAQVGGGKTVVIDYSAPNIAKPFGIGHLRSTNIGQAVYNIYKILGWKCIGDNHLGDWGTQFGKMICALKRWNDRPIDQLTIDDLEKLYVRFHQEVESNSELEIEGREWFRKLEAGDLEARGIWQQCVDISMREFNRVYELLDVKIDNAYGEAFYEKMLPEIVQLFRDKNLVEESNGALVIHYPALPDAILLKSDGATNYLTRDLATIKFRMEKWNPDLMIYEVGSPQKLHFQQVFAAAKMAGWETEYYHLAHGQMRSSSGSFSTRKGNTIHLAEVIDMAMEKAKKIAPDNDDESIRRVAIGAIKFADLQADPRKDSVFDWNKMMSMQGSSGPYLQYTYSRCKSVIEKTDKRAKIYDISNIGFDDNETSLLRYFYIFLEKIVEAGERYSPAVVAEYLLNLARKYNEFYVKCKIVGDERQEQRLWLTQVTAKILNDGLELLGIKTLERM